MIPNKLKTFVNSLDQYDWFCDAEMDNYGNLVVYVDRMDLNFIGTCPDVVDGTHVLFHWASSQFTLPIKVIEILPKIEVLDDKDVFDISYLIDELDRLKSICGADALESIFYETNDGKNSITDLSSEYPDVRRSMDYLYNSYGFDIIYEELDK